MCYLVAGRTILIEAFDEWIARRIAEVVAGWFFTPVPPHSTPDAAIRIQCVVDLPNTPLDQASFEITFGGTCFTDEKTYYLKFDNALVSFASDRTVPVDLWLTRRFEPSSSIFVQLLSHALSPALRRCGLFEVHSAGVVPPNSNTAIIIAGASGSGKSTLTAQLANAGWDYLSDDILLLSRDGNDLHLHAFRRFFALTANTLAAVSLPKGNSSGVTSSKHRLVPQDHFNRDPVEQSIPGALVFPTISGFEESQIKPLTPGETMSRLLRLCPWASYDKPTSIEHLRTLGRLANCASGFDLLAGADILNDSTVAPQLFSNISSKAV